MSTDKQDIRVVTALNGVHRTSLSEFIGKMDSGDESADTSSDDTTEGSENTETEEKTETLTESTEKEVVTKKNDKMDEDVYEVDGKKVSIKELLNNYETREKIHQRFSELDVKEKRIQKDKEEVKKAKSELAVINEKFIEMQEAVVNGNPLEALHIAMIMAQEGSEDVENAATIKMLVEQAEKVAENYHNMSADEREVAFEKERLKLKAKKIEKQEKKINETTKNAQIEQHFNAVLNKYNVSDAEMDVTYDEIQNLPKFKEELDKKDEIGKINYCASWILGKRFRATVEAGVARVDPKEAKNENLVLALLDLCDANYTQEQVEKIYRDYLKLAKQDSADGEKAASSSVANKKEATTLDRVPTEKPKAEKEDKPAVFMSFKDLIAKHSNK